MFRIAIASVVLLGAGVVAAEVPVAPAPREAKPDLSLIVIENVPNEEGLVKTGRVLRAGFRNGKMLPAETVWEGDVGFVNGWHPRHRLALDRYLVTQQGGVIDLRDKKVIHGEHSGQLHRIEGTKVIYTRANRNEVGVYSFDLTTRTRTYEHKVGDGKYGLPGELSPDGTASIETGPIADELFLHKPNQKRKSLGTGFHINISELSSTFGPSPVLWLDNNHFLTQRGNGKLVTVDLAGKTTEVLTIKDAPKDLVSAPYLLRDGSGRVVYWCGPKAYSIDVAKKTWAEYEWHDLGHGFTASWKADEKFGHKLRHKGKEIGWFHCWPYFARTAPGHLALEAQYDQERRFQPQCIAVWSEKSGEWETIKCWPESIVGWVK